jgi:hypothetical protein
MVVTVEAALPPVNVSGYRNGIWMLVYVGAGVSLLVIGYWLLVIGYWLLVIGRRGGGW